MHLDKQKQAFRIINSGLDAVMKVKWPRMESVSPGAQLSWHLHPQCPIKAWVPAKRVSPGQTSSFLYPPGGMQGRLAEMIGTSVQTYPKVRLGMPELELEVVCWRHGVKAY